jgi:hypoxanthine phosphoribosyltransferase
MGLSFMRAVNDPDSLVRGAICLVDDVIDTGESYE